MDPEKNHYSVRDALYAMQREEQDFNLKKLLERGVLITHS